MIWTDNNRKRRLFWLGVAWKYVRQLFTNIVIVGLENPENDRDLSLFNKLKNSEIKVKSPEIPKSQFSSSSPDKDLKY